MKNKTVSVVPGFILVVWVISVATWLFTSSYFDFEILASLSYFSNDGHCDPITKGVGDHCFGDYYYPLNLARDTNPWTNYLPYPASVVLLYRFFGFLEIALNSSKIALLAYLMLIGLALISPLMWLFQHSRKLLSGSLLVLLGPFSYAGLVALDRGNSVALIVPALFAFLIGIHKDDSRLALIGLIAASLIKPHYALLLIVFLLVKKPRFFLFGVIVGLTTHLVPYLFWWSSFPANIIDSSKSILRFNEYQQIESWYISQMSLARALFLVNRILGGPIGAESEIETFTTVQRFAGPILFVVIVVVLYITRKKVSPLLMGMALILVVTLIPGTVYPYYLVVLIPVFAMTLIADHSTFDHDLRAAKSSGFTVRNCLLFGTGLSGVIMPLPVRIDIGPVVATTLPTVPIIWVVTVMIVISMEIRVSGRAVG